MKKQKSGLYKKSLIRIILAEFNLQMQQNSD